MVVTARVDVLKLSRLVVMPLGVFPFEKKALDLVGGVERESFLLVELVGVTFQHAANVPRVSRAILIDHMSEDQDLARAKNVGRSPVKGAPIHRQAQVALSLCREPANRRPVKRQVIPALDQELFVVVQHVQAAFEVAEKHGHGLDALLVRQVLDPLLLDFVRGGAVLAMLFRLQVQFFKLVIGKSQEITQFVRHESPQNKLKWSTAKKSKAYRRDSSDGRLSRRSGERQIEKSFRAIEKMNEEPDNLSGCSTQNCASRNTPV